MILTLLDIKQAVTAKLKSKYPDYKVHFDNVEKKAAPYFYVEMRPQAKTVDDFFTDRTIQIHIQLILKEDCCGRIKRSELYRAADEIDSLFRPVLQIQDRYITVLESEMTLHDDVLHYIFELSFTDGLAAEEINSIAYELMQELELNINGGDR